MVTNNCVCLRPKAKDLVDVLVQIWDDESRTGAAVPFSMPCACAKNVSLAFRAQVLDH
jgi:hypothetical protein